MKNNTLLVPAFIAAIVSASITLGALSFAQDMPDSGPGSQRFLEWSPVVPKSDLPDATHGAAENARPPEMHFFDEKNSQMQDSDHMRFLPDGRESHTESSVSGMKNEKMKKMREKMMNRTIKKIEKHIARIDKKIAKYEAKLAATDDEDKQEKLEDKLDELSDQKDDLQYSLEDAKEMLEEFLSESEEF